MLDELDKAIIRCIQMGLPMEKEPYKIIANKLNIEEKTLLQRIEIMSDKGILRRVGAILNHRSVGFNANAMVVWCISEDKIEASGKQLALQSEISHCYQRPGFADWPYNVYTMVHAKTKEECENIIKKLADIIEVFEYEVLYSTTELKKTSFLYFEESL